MGSEPHEFIQPRPNPGFWARVKARAKEDERRQPGFLAYLVEGYLKYIRASAPGLIAPNGAGAIVSMVLLCTIMVTSAINERNRVRAAGGAWLWWKFVLGQVLGPIIALAAVVGLAYVFGGG